MLRRLIIAAIVAVSLGAPILELFDSWDQTVQAGNDTEGTVSVVALCIGVAFAVGTLIVVRRIRAVASAVTESVVLAHASEPESASLLTSGPTVSPQQSFGFNPRFPLPAQRRFGAAVGVIAGRTVGSHEREHPAPSITLQTVPGGAAIAYSRVW